MKITLQHNQQVIEANDSDSLFLQLKANGFNIKSTCGGCASCGQCIVVITDGESHLQQPTFDEKQLIGNVFHITKERLSCQTYITGDITVDISAHLKTDTKKKAVTMRRTREEAEKVVEDRKQASKEKRDAKPKRLGGGKKAKAFTFQDENEVEEETESKE